MFWGEAMPLPTRERETNSPDLTSGLGAYGASIIAPSALMFSPTKLLHENPAYE